MIQSNIRLHDSASSTQGLKDIERKLKDEIRIGEIFDAAAREPQHEAFVLDATSHLADYVRTVDRNVSRAFVVRNGQHVGIVYRNITNGSMLLLEMNYY